MVRYQFTPGSPTTGTPNLWPPNSHITLDTTRPNLVMSLHPQCPCSTASLHELETLMARANRPIAVHLLFVSPAGASSSWPDGNLLRQARAMPNVEVSIDSQGAEAQAFGATTSGDVALYDARGKLMFHGGITDGRGHEGDNTGLEAIRALLLDETPTVRQTAVYGCSLSGPMSTTRPAIAPAKNGAYQ